MNLGTDQSEPLSHGVFSVNALVVFVFFALVVLLNNYTVDFRINANISS